MPEGHTIHRMARDHQKWFAGQQVFLSSPQGRFAMGAALLNGQQFESAYAHGKHLFYRFKVDEQPANTIHIHLGLYGRYRKRGGPDEPPSPNCRLRMVTAERVLDLSGPTCCEVLTETEAKRKCLSLGPDPLRADSEGESFFERLKKRRIPIAAALLDQKVIAGLGNIYRADLLFQHGICPLTPANQISEATAKALWATSVWWLELGVRANRIITVLDEPPRKLPKLARRESVLIYKRRHCPRCSGGVSVSEVGNRTLYFCANCQTKNQ